MKSNRMLVRVFVVFIALVGATTASAGNLTWADLEHMAWPEAQQEFKGFSDTVRDFVWETVYGRPGEELYCGRHYAKSDTEHPKDANLTLEHAYPAKWAAQFFGYKERSCLQALPGRKQNRDACRAATGDPHNLWPADASANSSRRDYQYGVVADEPGNHPALARPCPDFLRTKGAYPLIYPPADARGDLARSIAYMHFVYDVPIEKGITDRTLVMKWINADPPSQEEKRRESEIRSANPCSWNPAVSTPPSAAARSNCASH